MKDLLVMGLENIFKNKNSLVLKPCQTFSTNMSPILASIQLKEQFRVITTYLCKGYFDVIIENILIL
jgi:hypothetical protein